MEKRKLLLVAVSVGVFLVIVLSAAILIFTPNGGGTVIARPVPAGESAAGAAVTPRLPASADAAEMVRNTGELQDLRVPPPGASPSASAIQENNFYFNEENSTQSSVAERGGSDPAQVVINVPKPSAPGVPAPSPRAPANTPAPQAKASPAAQKTAAKPPAASPAPSTAANASGASRPAGAASTATPAAAPAKPAAAAKAPATAAPRAAGTPASAAISTAARSPAPRSRAQQDYWIQTGAFSALVRAEDAKEILASKGLVPIIDDREVEGQTWYRVRIGPYTSENEANYWLALVRAINGFAQSQVRSGQR